MTLHNHRPAAPVLKPIADIAASIGLAEDDLLAFRLSTKEGGDGHCQGVRQAELSFIQGAADDAPRRAGAILGTVVEACVGGALVGLIVKE